MNNRLLLYIENSFLSPLLEDKNITDISYNGESLYYMHSNYGRKRFDYDLSKEEATDFIRQVANFAEKQFSYSEPILDISISRYRINAVHSSIVRVGDDKSISFSIRIGSMINRIKGDSSFMSEEMKKYLLSLLKKHESLVIAGSTGCGKTELQKYLITLLDPNSHIIVIDNIQELDGLRSQIDLDLTSWQVFPNIADRTFESLIRNALRSNPDWLIIAESRGKEMADILLSITSGHPIITTMHASEISEIPIRISRMIQLSNPNQRFEDVLSDVKNNFINYIFLKREILEDGSVKRYIDSIARINKDNKELEIVLERNCYEKI